MSAERVDFGAVALTAATRDLIAPLVLLRQLSFQLDNDPVLTTSTTANDVLEQMRLVIGRTFEIVDELRYANSSQQLAIEPVQLTGLCCELNRELQPLQQQLQCQLDFELPRRQTIMAIGNYQALRTILTGFLTDAMRANQIKDGQRIVRLRVTSRRNQAILTVSDDGPAINLTNSLRQTSNPRDVNPTKTRPQMSSLNLLLADRLLTAMNGRLLIHNHRQGGMTVEARLPASKQLSLFDLSRL